VNSREPRHNVAMRPPRNRRKLRNVLKKKSFAPQKVELQFLEKHKTLYMELHRDFTKSDYAPLLSLTPLFYRYPFTLAYAPRGALTGENYISLMRCRYSPFLPPSLSLSRFWGSSFFCRGSTSPRGHIRSRSNERCQIETCQIDSDRFFFSSRRYIE